MDEQMRERLAELEKDFNLGQSRLRELEMQEAALRETLLRISGAIQVLKELLGDSAETTGGGNSAASGGS
jgi:predicted nuclease with TOPRIM domain